MLFLRYCGISFSRGLGRESPVKNINIVKRNFIIAAITIVALASVGIHRINAATRVDVENPVTITAQVSSDDTSVFATQFNGTVTIELYKLATLDESGTPTLVQDFEGKGIDLAVLDNKPSVDDIKEKIVNPALEATENITTNDVITIDRGSNKTSGSKVIKGGAGIYLYKPLDTFDNRYSYTFTSYIVFAPTSTFIQTGTGDDTWNYESSFSLKSEETPLYGSLDITKTLDTFNSSLGAASFVYKVNAIRDDEVIFSNVYAIDFYGAGTQTRTINDIPADSIVTVTEVYTGASYQAVGDVLKEAYILADEAVEKRAEVTFENQYDNRLNVGGLSAENVFEEEDGVAVWRGTKEAR